MEVKQPGQHILSPAGLITAQAGLGHLAVVGMTSFLCWKSLFAAFPIGLKSLRGVWLAELGSTPRTEYP